MDPALRELLRNVSVNANDSSLTHVSLYGPSAKWSVPSHNLTNFWKGYCDLVNLKMTGAEAESNSKLCLAEKTEKEMPVMAKLTFKFHQDPSIDDSWEPFDDYLLQWICYYYQMVIEENFSLKYESKMELYVVVLETVSPWYEEDSDGQKNIVFEVKLQFPYAKINGGIQSRIIRPKVIQLLRNNNVMSKLQKHPIGDWDQIISQNFINEPIVMFGSSEFPDKPKLEVTHIWPSISVDLLESGNVEDIPIESVFELGCHQHIQQNLVKPDIFPLLESEDDSEESVVDFKYCLPFVLSILYWNVILLPKPELHDDGRFANITRTTQRNAEETYIFGSNKNKNVDIVDNIPELAETMIQMLNPKRFLEELFWLDIGKALYHSNSGSENGVMSWIRHTEKILNNKKVPEYMTIASTISETCKHLYYTFANTHITVKTLAWYAREDVPDQYKSWHRDWCLVAMEQSLSGCHSDVGIAFYRIYWLDFMYCAIGKGGWFKYKNHRWTTVHQGIDISSTVSGDFKNRFESIRANLTNQVCSPDAEEGFKNTGEQTLKKIVALTKQLKTGAFKSNIVQEAREYFNNDRFMSLLDTNAELTGITNGVLEVFEGKVFYRIGKPEDYLSMCTNIPYHTNYTWDHPLVKECMKWFGQVFTDKQLLHHFLKFSASCLRGRNSDKIFPIWTGDGDNSKSMIVKLFESTFSSYCIKLPVSLLSEKSANSGGPTPQLARAKSTRVAFLDEPEDDVPMHKGTIKRFSGGDTFFARLLQENGGDVQATFKMILMCNKVPLIPNADKAIKNRTRLFPFMSTWVDKAPESEAEQLAQRKFQKNVLFEKRIPILAPAFLWIMTIYYPYYAAEGLTDPPVVTETTETYWRDNDVYAQFAADTIQEVINDGVRDSGARVTLAEIYAEFKIWFRDAFPGTKVPERSIVRTELTSRWGRMQANSWWGVRIISGGTVDMTTALGGASRRPDAVKKPSPQNISAPPSLINIVNPELQQKPVTI